MTNAGTFFNECRPKSRTLLFFVFAITSGSYADFHYSRRMGANRYIIDYSHIQIDPTSELA
jgi:hypothetical protein